MRRINRKVAVKQKIGVGWYTPDEWEILKQISEDRDKLDDTYEEWKANAEGVMRRLQSAGALVEWVPVDIVELLEWCQNQGRAVIGPARSEFVMRKINGLL